MAKLLPIINHVKTLREQKGLTQEELGTRIGVTRQTVAAIEQRRYSPSLETAFKIANEFNTGLASVFEWDDKNA